MKPAFPPRKLATVLLWIVSASTLGACTLLESSSDLVGEADMTPMAMGNCTSADVLMSSPCMNGIIIPEGQDPLQGSCLDGNYVVTAGDQPFSIGTCDQVQGCNVACLNEDQACSAFLEAQADNLFCEDGEVAILDSDVQELLGTAIPDGVDVPFACSLGSPSVLTFQGVPIGTCQSNELGCVYQCVREDVLASRGSRPNEFVCPTPNTCVAEAEPRPDFMINIPLCLPCDTSACNNDGMCDDENGEDANNCPADCGMTDCNGVACPSSRCLTDADSGFQYCAPLCSDFNLQPGELVCDQTDENVSYECVGTLAELRPCSDTTVCAPSLSQCVEAVAACTPGTDPATRCADDNGRIEYCDETLNRWVIAESCDDQCVLFDDDGNDLFYCSGQACNGPGDRRCSLAMSPLGNDANFLEECVAEGAGVARWRPIEDCEDGDGGACSVTGGVAQCSGGGGDTCVNGAERCKQGTIDIVERCVDGEWQDWVDCDQRPNDTALPGGMARLGPMAQCFDDGGVPSEAGCYPAGSSACERSQDMQTQCSPNNSAIVQECDGIAWTDAIDCRVPSAANQMTTGDCFGAEPGNARCLPEGYGACMPNAMDQCDPDDPYVRNSCQLGLFVPVQDCSQTDQGTGNIGVCNTSNPANCGSVLRSSLENCDAAELNNTRCMGDRIKVCEGVLNVLAFKWVTQEHCALPPNGQSFFTCYEDMSIAATCVPIGSTPCLAGTPNTRSCSMTETDLVDLCDASGVFQRPVENCQLDVMFGSQCNDATAMCGPPMMMGGGMMP